MSVPPLPIPSEETTGSAIDLRPSPIGGGRLPGVGGRSTTAPRTASGRRLVLLRLVGKGGFGEVYEGRMETPGGLTRRVAVKLLRADVMDDDTLARTIDEAHLLTRLSHPTVVAVEDLVNVDDRIAIVSEFVEGVDLAERMPLPPAVALEVIARVAEALHAAWSATGQDGAPLRIVHRDIKPSNIRLGRHGVVKLLDFGIARGAGERRVKTGSGLLVGSLGYVAPERWIGDEEGHGSDVYALGSVLLEAISGRPLMAGLPPVRQLAVCSDADAHDARVREHVEAVPQLREHAPVADVILKMLAWDPDHRPSASEVASLARRAQRHLEGDGLLAWSGTIVVPRSDWSTARGTVLAETDQGFTVSDLRREAQEAPADDGTQVDTAAAEAAPPPAVETAEVAAGASVDRVAVSTSSGTTSTSAPETASETGAEIGPTRRRGSPWVGLLALAAVLVVVVGGLGVLGAAGAAAWLGGAFTGGAVDEPDVAAAGVDGASGAGSRSAGPGAASDDGPDRNASDEGVGEPEPLVADLGELADRADREADGPSDDVPEPTPAAGSTPRTDAVTRITGAMEGEFAGGRSEGELLGATEPEAKPEPEIVVVPRSTPKPADTTPSRAPAAMGTVVVTDFRNARLRGPSGVVPLGRVPAGRYQLEVAFDEGVWTAEPGWVVKVAEGQTVTWKCVSRFRRCDPVQ